MNREAMRIPQSRLLDTLKDRIEGKRSLLAEREKTWGKDRIYIHSYMENLALPELFGFDMNDFFSDAQLAIEVELRHRIFWLDNSQDDGVPGLDMAATAGMYYDMTLFGARIWHTPGGVPEFMPHPIAETPDLSLLTNFDFHTTGVMPDLLRQYNEMRRLAAEEYGGQFKVGFPGFGRGPLDIYIQLRGYDSFAMDTMERPEFVHAFMTHLVNERARFRRARSEFLGEALPTEATTSIADDWVNIPFLSPGMFREFVLPAYRLIQQNEGSVTGFHTCGVMVPIVKDLLNDFPGLRWLDVSGWNDFEELDRMVDPDIGFSLSCINSFVLSGSQHEYHDKLDRMNRVRKHRPITLNVQAIVRLHDDFEEDLRRMNAFISLARETMSG